jgi:hypothetical protein
MSAFKLYAVKLANLGYSPVPILPGEKRPLPVCDHYAHWNELRERALTEKQINGLARWKPDLGLGVAGGYNCLVPVDFDMTDPAIKRAAASAIPKMVVAKRGRKGGTPFYWNPDGMIEGCKFKRKLEDGGWDMLVEVLVTGQTVLPPTIHPDTLAPYEWRTPATLFNTKVDDLPRILDGHVQALAASLSKWIAKPKTEQKSASVFNGQMSDDERMKAWARAALRREADELSGFTQGRNLGIFFAGCNIGKYIWHGILRESEVERQLLNASVRNGYNNASHGGHSKALKSLRSGVNKSRNDRLPELDKYESNQLCAG